MTYTQIIKPQLPTLCNLDHNRPIHLSGVGGSAMNGLAILLKQRKFKVIGTDPNPDTNALTRLKNAQISVFTQQDGSKIQKDTQLLVTTAALSNDHAELKTARKLGIPIVKYAEMLGIIMNDAANAIAIAGTHGKTTTTAFTVAALRGACDDPGFLIGGFIPQFGASAFAGTSQTFIAEACEYDRSFLNLKPKRAIITNIEADHLDIYKDLDEIMKAFSNFADGITKEGMLFYNIDNQNASLVAKEFAKRNTTNSKQKIISFSVNKNANYRAQNIRQSNDKTIFELWHNNKKLTDIQICIPGLHNVSNAIAAFAVGHDMGFAPKQLALGLANFAGITRRFEIKGTKSNITIIDDYAHHPTEIRALIQGAKSRFKNCRLIIGFQPHQISRTHFLMEEFATAFNGADLVILTDIYAARDYKSGDLNTTSSVLVKKIKSNGVKVKHVQTLDELCDFALQILKPNDIFISSGAGDIYKIATKILNSLPQ